MESYLAHLSLGTSLIHSSCTLCGSALLSLPPTSSTVTVGDPTSRNVSTTVKCHKCGSSQSSLRS